MKPKNNIFLISHFLIRYTHNDESRTTNHIDLHFFADFVFILFLLTLIISMLTLYCMFMDSVTALLLKLVKKTRDVVPTEEFTKSLHTASLSSIKNVVEFICLWTWKVFPQHSETESYHYKLVQELEEDIKKNPNFDEFGYRRHKLLGNYNLHYSPLKK